MCLAIPGKVVEIFNKNGLLMGRVDYGGTSHETCLEYVPEVNVGQYAIVHAGFALSILDEEEAKKTLDTWSEMVDAVEKEGLDIFGNPIENKPND
ncbi:MAG: HypC/HybG/HupF family hydrogenase formation chaperone [Candidatus Marinimicrobia bacterium]|jgi:hydrogenase expression/formation protein HypC|nr:HypC/HybG/HupF family hydrogenase formation chaperone [Candidatus Neomarinimicrobiota bacterium]|tara:strand:+ start:9012 stop:9296 length:285 start_codon:yes stop_codon:yes gene_type:complete